MKLVTLLLALGVLLPSCTADTKIEVEHYGTLRDIMMNNDFSSKVNLKEFQESKDLYAVGALEGVQGEILIIDSRPLIAHFDKALMIIDSSYNFNAALLVTATVPGWKTIPLEAKSLSPPEFEEFLIKESEKNGFSRDNAFPFIIEGKVDSLDWHVMNGTVPKPGQDHRDSGVKGKISNQEVTLLGFYSDHDQGIFTHHDSHFHIHVMTKDKRIVGHVDDFQLGEEMILKIPSK